MVCSGGATATGDELGSGSSTAMLERFNGTRGTGSVGRVAKAETDGATVIAVTVATKGPSAQYAPEE